MCLGQGSGTFVNIHSAQTSPGSARTAPHPVDDVPLCRLAAAHSVPLQVRQLEDRGVLTVHRAKNALRALLQAPGNDIGMCESR